MSTRERWIVYPLLFLALGAAVRDKMIAKIEIPPLVCDRLEVNGQSVCRIPCLICDRLEVKGVVECGQSVCRELLVVKGVAECGKSVCRELLVVGPNGRPVVAASFNPRAANAGTIETLSANGLPLVQLDSLRLGEMEAGQMLVFGDAGKTPRLLAKYRRR